MGPDKSETPQRKEDGRPSKVLGEVVAELLKPWDAEGVEIRQGLVDGYASVIVSEPESVAFR